MKEVRLLLPQGHFTVPIDLKDGYWQIPIAPSKRPFLGFILIFTKLVNHIVQVVSDFDIFMLAYLQNLLIAAATTNVCAEHLQIVLHVSANHGWLVSERKSRFTPSQTFRWLGLL